MTYTHLKIAAITSVAILASAGTALAGGENCDDKKKAALKTKAAASQTAVMSASETVDAKNKMTKVKADRKVLGFEEAMKLCLDKGADDMQACIDYKTGVTKVYKKTTS